MSRRTILFVHSSDPGDPIGGGEASLLALMERLDRRRYRPVVAISGRGEFHDRLEAAGIECHVVPMDPLYVTVAESSRLELAALVFRGFLATLRLALLIQRQGAELVCTNVQAAHLYGAFAARVAGRPLVMYMRDIPQGGFSRRLFPWLGAHFAQRIICISNAVRRFFTDHPRHGPGLADKAVVVFNGIDVAHLTPQPPSERLLDELRLRDAHPVVTIIGRLQPWKGQREFLEAAARVRHSEPGARFLVVGEAFAFQSEFRAELEALVKLHRLEDAVTFTGQRSDIAELLSVTDILVCASHHEPFGRVIVEAMAMARPVVATAAGGVPDIVADGDTGLLVPVGDVEALATAIVLLAADRDSANQMGGHGRLRARRYFAIENTVKNASAVFDRV